MFVSHCIFYNCYINTMRIKFLFSFICVTCFINVSSYAQIAAFQNCPLKFKIVTQNGKTFEYGCAVTIEDNIRIIIENKSKEAYFYTLLDINPDNEILVLNPTEISEDFRINGDTIIYLPHSYTISPPYGIDKELLIVSKTPYIGEAIQNTLQQVILRGTVEFTKSQLLQEVIWILQGQPSSKFKDCYFSVMDMAIIPKAKENTGKSIINFKVSCPIIVPNIPGSVPITPFKLQFGTSSGLGGSGNRSRKFLEPL